MGNYPWEPEYCVYDVCMCSHAFMEHEKGPTKCYNSSYFDSAKQEVIKTEKCPCKKFQFSRSEGSFSLYTEKGETR